MGMTSYVRMKLIGASILGIGSWKCGDAAYSIYHLFGNCDLNTIHGMMIFTFAAIASFSGLGALAMLAESLGLVK